MIGIHAILLKVAFGILGLFLLMGAISGLIPPREASKAIEKKDVDDIRSSKFLLIFSFVFLAAVGNLMLRELHFHSELSHLRAEAVHSIEIGDRSVTDRQQIVEIVAVLNHAEWFSLRKGDDADPVPFVVNLASGKEYHYEATRYQHGEGAALVSRSPSGWENGQVFCRKLPASLAKAGVTLPPCFTYFGESQHCAPPD
jgi:hypothetical protein